jgi:hypothetical protein
MLNLSASRLCHRGVGRWTEETVGFSEWTSQFSVSKTTGKDSSEACAFAYKNEQFTQFLRQVWRHTLNSLSLTKNVESALNDLSILATRYRAS